MEEFHGKRAQQERERGLGTVPESRLNQGRFGRLFRSLPAYRLPGNELIAALVSTMREPEEDATGPSGWSNVASPSPFDHPDLPAGYTYLGQFIDHDLTFDPTSQLDRENDPNALRNFRTPRFDLDSVYGRGPHDQPYMYEDFTLRIEERDDADGHIEDPPRYGNRALIGDPRNDENAIVAQLQVLFLRAHNKALRLVQQHTGLGGEEAFREARRVLRWHYQYVVLNDFLERIVGAELVAQVLDRDPADRFPRFDLRHYTPENEAFMPVEFSVAAYRFGHTLVRPSYKLNDAHEAVEIFSTDNEDLRGFRPLQSKHRIEWKHFFDEVEGREFQLARKIDTKLSPGLSKLPFEGSSLARMNLKRGEALGLPSGQSVAAAMCAERLGDADLSDLPEAVRTELRENTPLWFHVLREAERRGEGKRLGPVGGRIVAEVFFGIMRLDPLSYLHVEPCWTPAGERSLPQPIAPGVEKFRMGHLVKWATTE